VDALPEQDVCVHKILAERRSPIYSCSEILRLWPARRSEVDMIFTATRVINSRVNAISACGICGEKSRIGYLNPDGSRTVRCGAHRFILSAAKRFTTPADPRCVGPARTAGSAGDAAAEGKDPAARRVVRMS